MSRLGLGLGLSKGRAFSPFDPLSLNPLLWFDMQESMMAPLASESLDLDPANPSSLDVITATRAGTATYTDASGNIQTASPNTVRVDHVQGEQLTPTKYQRVGYTDFSSGWASSGATISNTDPYDSSVAKRVSVTGFGVYYSSTPVSNSTQYTATFYARLVSGSSSNVKFYTSSTGLTYTALTLTSEWQIFTKNITTTGTSVNFGIANTAGTEPVVVEISQPQLEEGTTASDFVENTTGSPKYFAAATYAPRVPMILVEPSATNLVENSEDFDGSYWSPNNLTITPNADSLGTANVSLLQESTYTSALPRIELSSGFGNTSGEHTFSFYVKNNNNTRYVGFSFGSSSERIRDTFDLQTETFKGSIFSGTTTGSVSFDRLGDYYRINVTATFPSPVTVQVAIAPLATNTYLFYANQDSGNRSFYLWGAQAETGSVATSYIPTSGSTVTRAADDLVIDGSDFTDFFNNSEGTIYCEFEYDFEPAYEYIYNIRQDGNNEIRNQFATSSNVRTRYVVAGVSEGQTSVSGAIQGSLNRNAYSYKTNNFRSSVNGSTEVEDLTGTASVSPIKLQIGGREGVISNIKFKRLITWPHHSDNL